MSKSSNKNDRDWSRCFEGFTDFSDKSTASATGKPKKESNNKLPNTSFRHGNIFENLGLHQKEETSQSITWSSSDNEKTSKSPEVKKRKKSESTRRSNKSNKPPSKPRATRSRQRAIFDDIDIQAESDTEKAAENSSSQKSQNAGILGYESDQEVARSAEIKDDQKCNSQQSPSIVESVSSATPCSPDVKQSVVQPGPRGSLVEGLGLKASDWVKTLQLKTPTKSDPQLDTPNVEDSGKKKKKHSRGGLAEQLSRLQARDKSAVRMWSHQQSKPSSSQDSKSITLEVTGFETLYSMQLVKCSVCQPSTVVETADSSQDLLSNQSGSSADNRVNQSVTGTAADQSQRLVLFPVSQSEQMNVQIGSWFTVFPPWQELELHGGRSIMLCTKYCRLVKQADVPSGGGDRAVGGVDVTRDRVGMLDAAGDGSRGSNKYTRVKATWNCPCVEGLCRNETLCPAYKFPSTPGLEKTGNDPPPVSGDSSEKDKNSNHVKSGEPVSGGSSRHLQTITSGPIKSSVSAPPPRTICTSLLESIEACRCPKGNNQGDKSGVCFQGRVRRAVWCKNKEKEKRCHLFVEDTAGTVCEVQLSSTTMSALKLEPVSCQGRSLSFTGLKVQDRVVRDREPALFSMVDLFWSGISPITSQEGDQSQQKSSSKPEPPGFCYILQEDSSRETDIQPSHDASQNASVVMDWCPIREVVQKAQSGTRCSFVARIIHVQDDLNSDCVLYAADRSVTGQGNQHYVKIVIQSTCDFTHNSTNIKYVCLRDAFIHSGRTIHADQYTQVHITVDLSRLEDVPSSHIKEYLSKFKVTLPGYNRSLQVNDLCYMKGKIVEVDEDSAYSWEVCTQCGNDLVLKEDTNQTECKSCQMVEENPITKMKMEVFISYTGAFNSTVKVDLLQGTIEVLLPQDEMDEDGYELTSVLDKEIGPLHCIVVSTGSSALLREITLVE